MNYKAWFFSNYFVTLILKNSNFNCSHILPEFEQHNPPVNPLLIIAFRSEGKSLSLPKFKNHVNFHVSVLKQQTFF